VADVGAVTVVEVADVAVVGATALGLDEELQAGTSANRATALTRRPACTIRCDDQCE
jgi:uncharacterized protein YjlB